MSKKAENATKDTLTNEVDVKTKRTTGQQLESEKKQKKEFRQKTRQAARTKGKKRFIYSGPYVTGGAIIPGGIYMEIPETLNDIIEKLPEIKDLFVEDKKYPDFKKVVKIQGTEPHRLYHYVEESIKKGVLNNASK